MKKITLLTAILSTSLKPASAHKQALEIFELCGDDPDGIICAIPLPPAIPVKQSRETAIIKNA